MNQCCFVCAEGFVAPPPSTPLPSHWAGRKRAVFGHLPARALIPGHCGANNSVAKLKKRENSGKRFYLLERPHFRIGIELVFLVFFCFYPSLVFCWLFLFTMYIKIIADDCGSKVQQHASASLSSHRIRASLICLVWASIEQRGNESHRLCVFIGPPVLNTNHQSFP